METCFEVHKEVKVRHFLNRLLERFGLSLTNDQYNRIVYEIEYFVNKPIIIDRKNNTFNLFNIDGTDVVIFFDWQYMVPTTVYYKSWFKKNNNGSYYLVKKKFK